MPISEPQSRPRLSILMVAHHYYPYLGGLERQAHMLSRALVREGCRVTVVTGRSAPEMARYEWLDGVEVWRLPTHTTSTWRRACSFVAALPFALTALIRRYDVVHAHSISWFLAGCIPVARLWGKPCIIKIPNVREYGIPGLQQRRFGHSLVSLIARADSWVALGAESNEELRSAGFAPQRIFQTSNGVDTATFYPISPEEKKRLRAKLGLAADELVVIFAGRLSPEKGLIDLLTIWPEVQASGDSVTRLMICGSGPQGEELASFIHQHQIFNIHFAGSVPNLSTYYQAADLFVLPSYAEGNSNALLEAMACGLPVVSTNVGGTPELVGHYAHDCLVDPGDRLGLKTKLIQFLSDERQRDVISSYLWQRVQDRYSILHVAQQYLACYQLMIARQADRIIELREVV